MGEAPAHERAGVFRLRPETLHIGLSAVWNPRRVGPALEGFLRLLRENRERIARSGGG